MPPSEGSVSWTVFVWSSGKMAGRGAWAAVGVADGGGDAGTPDAHIAALAVSGHSRRTGEARAPGPAPARCLPARELAKTRQTTGRQTENEEERCLTPASAVSHITKRDL